LLPDQDPEALQESALVELQLKVALWLQVTEPLVRRLTVGVTLLHDPLLQVSLA
jgi:hypothetical protein